MRTATRPPPTAAPEPEPSAPPPPAAPARSRGFIQPHPVLAYYALAFAISWGGVLLVAGGPGGMPGTSEQVARLLPLAFLAMGTGPSLAGILMTGLLHGRVGLREFLSRLLRWRLGARWYAVALLTTPLLVTTVDLTLSPFSPEFLPRMITSDDRATRLLLGLAAGLAPGIVEELGWTGFAVPGLRRRHGVLATGLIAGFLWRAWHLPLLVWMTGGPSGAFSLPLFLPALLSALGLLPAYRVLMVWVHEHTESLPVAMLMHASNTASSFILGTSATGLAASAHNLVVIAALWACVAGLAVTNRRRRPRQPLRARVT